MKVKTMNQVQLIGRVGSEITRHNDVVEFSFATTERWRTREGETQEETEWHDIKAFGAALCDVAEKHFSKGKPLFIQGKIKTETWEKRPD